MTAPFGPVLKEWRQRRRMSQLDLGLSADVSARHISFLETGRSRPSRGMVLRLCDELDMPRAARNQLLLAAGLSPAYESRSLSDTAMAPVRTAVDWMLDRHAPYPAFAVDRHWVVVEMNSPARQLLGAVGLGQGVSVARALAHHPALRAALVNLDEVVAHAIARLRTESAHLGGDPVLDAAIRDLAGGGVTVPAHDGLHPAFVPAHYRLGDLSLSLFSTFTQFGSAEDIALSELKIEMMFPADETTRATLEALASAG